MMVAGETAWARDAEGQDGKLESLSQMEGDRPVS